MPETSYDELNIRVGLIDRPWVVDAKYLDVMVAMPSGTADLAALRAAVEAVSQNHPHVLRSARNTFHGVRTPPTTVTP